MLVTDSVGNLLAEHHYSNRTHCFLQDAVNRKAFWDYCKFAWCQDPYTVVTQVGTISLIISGCCFEIRDQRQGRKTGSVKERKDQLTIILA